MERKSGWSIGSTLALASKSIVYKWLIVDDRSSMSKLLVAPYRGNNSSI